MTVYRECVDSTVYGTVRAHSAETARGRRTVEQRRDGQASKRDAHCGCRKGNKKVRTKFIVRGVRVCCESKTLHRCTCKKLRVMNVRRSTPTRQQKIHGNFFFFFFALWFFYCFATHTFYVSCLRVSDRKRHTLWGKTLGERRSLTGLSVSLLPCLISCLALLLFWRLSSPSSFFRPLFFHLLSYLFLKQTLRGSSASVFPH